MGNPSAETQAHLPIQAIDALGAAAHECADSNVYFWVDGIYVQAPLEDEAQCLLVIIGATPERMRELIGLADGLRESAQSWRDLLLDLKRRGLSTGPQLTVGDGALGFWKALDEVWPNTRMQRCWVHKTANVLNKLPNSRHAKAKRALHHIWMAETRNCAEVAFDGVIETYGRKYEKAVECLTKDRDTLLAFYDFPAERWRHLRTTRWWPSSLRGCLAGRPEIRKYSRQIVSHLGYPGICLAGSYSLQDRLCRPKLNQFGSLSPPTMKRRSLATSFPV